MDLTPYIPQLITAISTLTAAFGVMLLNRRYSAKDREIDYNRELCRDLFMECFKAVHMVREVIKHTTMMEQSESMQAALTDFRSAVFECISKSALVAPAIEPGLWDVYQCVLEEAASRKRVLREGETLGDIAMFGAVRSGTDDTIVHVAEQMRTILGLKVQRAYVRTGRMDIIPIDEQVETLRRSAPGNTPGERPSDSQD